MVNVLEKSKLLVRMTAEDRQAINRMIRHKCDEFESVIQRGIVAMLNAQEESEKLAEKRAEYLSFLTSRNQQKKEQLKQIGQATSEAISQAPMGIGSAGQLVISAATGTGNAIYNNVEQKRQQTEAEERLFSAQMLFYIPPQDYDKIARRVARILSYRYQFLIFRLAAGENGYIKLANFFSHAMRSYAVARLRERKNDVVRALLNAAIPPSTDTINYRDWPSIDFPNFRTHLNRFGTRKTLELDDAASAIVRRCGPAVRAILGGYESYIDPNSSQVKRYQLYTIIGALNHALILNTDSRIHSGILPPHRQYIALDGNVKYPMILLGQGETTADLGVNFATRSTNIILEDLHREALKRLVPDFFNHKVFYSLDKEPEELAIAENIRYLEEKYECPWSLKRESQWQEKLQAIFLAKNKVSAHDEIENFEHSAQLRSMFQTANQHYLQSKIKDAVEIENEAFTMISRVFKAAGNTSQERKQSAQTANYTLYSAHEIIRCMRYAQRFEPEQFELVRHLIETANLAIYASRDLAFHETWVYQNSLIKIKDLQLQLVALQNAHRLHEMHFSTLLEAIEDFPHLTMGTKLLKRESLLNFRKTGLLKKQISEQLREIQKMVEMGQAIKQYDEQFSHSSLDISQAFQVAEEEMKRARHDLTEYPDNQNYPTLINCIEICLETIDFHLSFMEKIELKNSAIPVRLTIPLEKNIDAMRSELMQEKARLEDYKQQRIPRVWLQQSQYRSLIDELKTWLKDLLEKTSHVQSFFDSISYVPEIMDEELNIGIQNFFKRAMLARQFNFIRYINAQKTNPKSLSSLYEKTKSLYLCYKSNGATLAQSQYEQSQIIASRLSSGMPIYELRKILQTIKRDKEWLELRVRDDIEVSEIAMNQAKILYRDAELISQDLQEIHNKIESIRENTDKFESLMSEDGLPIESSFKSIAALFNYFEEKLNIIVQQVIEHGMLPEKEHDFFRSRQQLAFCQFKENIKDPNNLVFNQMLGIHFLSVSIKNIYQIEFRNFSHLTPLSDLRKILNHNQDLQAVDYNELPITQKKALKLLKKSYQSMLELNLLAKKFHVEQSLDDLTAINFVRSILMWSSSYHIHEQKWIDKKLARQSRKFLENIKEHKSPSRMAFSFLISIINDHLIYKKRDLNRLRKLEAGLEKINLYPLSLEISTSEETHNYTWFSKNKEDMTTTIGTKITLLEKELDELILSRKKFIHQALSLYFYEWREKTFEATYICPPSFFKIAQATPNDNQSVTVCTQYAIESLEEWFESYKKLYEEKTHTQLPKSEMWQLDEISESIETNMFSPKSVSRR